MEALHDFMHHAVRRDRLQARALAASERRNRLAATIAEREALLKQFAELARRLEVIQAEQHQLLEERNGVKAQVSEHEGKRVEIRQVMQDMIEKRLQAQHDKQHYATKLEEEKGKVDDANLAVEQVQEEFTVGYCYVCCCGAFY